jgi:rod shape-determining protein MreD
MRDFVEIALAVIIAILFKTMLSAFFPPLIFIFNIFSLVVIYFAVSKDEVHGALIGMLCGFIQDSYSLGVFGVYGLAKTIMGYTAGFLSKRVNIVPLSRKFVFMAAFVSFELILWSGLYRFIFSESINTGKGLMFFQPLGTAALGIMLIPLAQKLKKRFSR